MKSTSVGKVISVLCTLSFREHDSCLSLKARRRGIVDESTGVFFNVKTGDRLPLSDAIEAGLVTAEYENGQESTSNGGTETKTYAVNSIVDQVRVKCLGRGSNWSI